MKIYFNSEFIITKREHEEYYQGSDYHNKLIVAFPKLAYENYTYIYPVFNVKRADSRVFGEYAITDFDTSDANYITWSCDLPNKALEVEGTLEITVLFRYSTDGKYAKVSTGKVLLNVKEAVIGEENDVIFTGSGDNLQGEIDAIRNEFGVRFDNVETQFISDLAELDSYTTPGLYKFNLNNTNTFHLFVIQPTSSLIEQTRSSRKGYYTRTIYNGVADEWRHYGYNVNGVVNYDSSVSYDKGAIVNNSGDLYLSLQNNNTTPLTASWKKLDFASFVYRNELNGYVPKEEGKGLSTNDLTNALLAKLNALKNYDDTAINNKITAIERILVSDNVDLDTLQEIVDVLEENEGDINAIFTAIAKKVDKDGLKTINGESIVGSGDIVIQGSSSGDSGVVELDLTAEDTLQELIDALISKGYQLSEVGDIVRIELKTSDFDFGDIYIKTTSSSFGPPGAEVITIKYKLNALKHNSNGKLQTLNQTYDVSITLSDIYNNYIDYYTPSEIDNKFDKVDPLKEVLIYNTAITFQGVIDKLIELGYTDLQFNRGNVHIKLTIYPYYIFKDIYIIRESNSEYKVVAYQFLEDGLKTLDKTITDTSITMEEIYNSFKSVATTQDIENAASDYLKNNDARPDEYFDAAYEGITLRGAGDSDGTSAIGVDTYGFQAYATGEGYSYFYLGADGSVQIIGDKELLINNKSFDKLYEDVQLLKGSYDLLRPSNGMAYTYEVDSNMAKYAMISQIGGMSYKSNNLLVLDDVEETTLNGITYSVKDGVIKLSGTSTASVFITLPVKSISLNGSYARNGFNNFAVATYDDIYLRFRDGTAGAFESNFLYFNSQNKTGTMSYTNATFDQLAINIKSGITCSNYIIKPMLVSGTTTPTTWELGFEGVRHTKVTNIVHKSANLIQLDDVSSTTKNGITYKVKNGVITINGTTTSAFGINLPLVKSIPVGTYTLNRFGDKGTDGSTFGICYSNGWEMGVQIAFNNDTTYKTATITNEGTYLRLYLNSNGTYSNYTLKPMLVSGTTTPANYSPYAEYANISLNNLYEMEGYGLGINNTCYNYLDFDKDVLVRRVKEIDLSTLNWSITEAGTSHERFKAKFSDIRLDGVINSQILAGGEYVGGYGTDVYGHKIDKCIAIEAANYFVVYDSRYINNLSGFKEYLQNNPTKIVYELVEPTEVAIPEIDTFIDVSSGGIITFENEYKQAVPYEIKYIRVV